MDKYSSMRLCTMQSTLPDITTTESIKEMM
jgi:hypothetical protein